MEFFWRYPPAWKGFEDYYYVTLHGWSLKYMPPVRERLSTSAIQTLKRLEPPCPAQHNLTAQFGNKKGKGRKSPFLITIPLPPPPPAFSPPLLFQ